MRTIFAGLLWVAFITQLLSGSVILCLLSFIAAVVRTVVAVKAHKRYRADSKATVPMDYKAEMRHTWQTLPVEDREWFEGLHRDVWPDKDAPALQKLVRTPDPKCKEWIWTGTQWVDYIEDQYSAVDNVHGNQVE